MAKQNLLRIDLNSNVFRYQSFINWLSLNYEAISTGISIIVFLETLFWYMTKDLSVDDFKLDLQEIKAVVTIPLKILSKAFDLMSKLI